jgi:phospholipid/cholesterol/gamma-HCH transport system substrate-binding protein
MASGGQRVMPRRLQGRINPLRAGSIALLIIVIATWLAFTKSLPWRNPFEFHAVFQTSNNLRLDSPVRIAGVNVGKVVGVERAKGSDLAEVTMEMDDQGLPIHEDATLKIRSRIFLEGNFFVDMSPGTPSSPTIDDGDTIPITRTATPVQLDQLLTALQTNDRESLQDLLKGLGNGLTSTPSAQEDADQDPSVAGESAAKSLNDSITYAPDALKGSAAVNKGLLGTEPHDLSKLIAGLDKVVTALGTNEEQLKDLITNFNRFFAIFAAEQVSLTAAVAELGPTLEIAQESLKNLNAALPDIAGFARDLTPGVAETPATITAFTPWIAQARQLFSQPEAGKLLADLQPATADLASVVNSSFALFNQTNLFSQCFNDVILPAGDTILQDGVSTTGVSAAKELWYAMVGFASEAQGFDGNGTYVRTATGGGDILVRTGKLPNRPKGRDVLYGHALVPPQGTRPKRPSSQPPYKTNRACYKNALPNLNGPAAAAGPPDKVGK